MSKLYSVLFLLLGLCVCRTTVGQTPDTSSTRGEALRVQPFEQFVGAVEARTDYRFYYNPAEVDSLQVRLPATDKPLPYLLTRLFAGTRLRFAIDPRHRVFITLDRAIRTELPPDFFARNQPGAAKDTAYFADEADGQKARFTLESRVFEIGVRSRAARSGFATLTGRIRNSRSGEPMTGVAVLVEKPRVGVLTDQYGSYSISLPQGRHELKIQSLGLRATKRQVLLLADGHLDIAVDEAVIPLKEVVIGARKDANVSGLQMGTEQLDIKIIRQVPTVLGEADLLRVVLTLPGVKSVGEGTVGFNVRGGSAGQNLILFNETVLYNPSHLFGFFSAFNPDIIKTVDLYKGAIPARYGGRLSSVLAVTTREGNRKKLAAAGGIGPLTGRLTLEGPMGSEKTSFLVGGRFTYSDWLLRQLPNRAYQNSQAAFYDLNLYLTHDFNDKSSLYLTAYTSRDQFRLNGDSLYTYRNQTASLKWNYRYSPKLSGAITGSYSRYQYAVGSETKPLEAFRFGFDIRQSTGKADLTYYPNARHTLDFGLSTTHYALRPGSLQPVGSASLINSNVVPTEQGLENALYIGDQFEITSRLSISAGLRYSLFLNLGPSQVFSYASGLPRQESTIQDTTAYAGGRIVQTYQGPEYRLALRYSLTDQLSVKASYNRTRQYLHMLSNTVAVSPLDIYKLSDSYLKPQIGDQYSVGLYQNLRGNALELSVEGYYRTLQNQLDYRSGGTLLLNHHLETDVVRAEGVAYGVELMVRKPSGKLNGWISYTYSRSLLRTPATFLAADLVNAGTYYPSSYDKPHDATLIGNYKLNRRFSVSVNATYSTGRPITLPLAKYVLGGAERVLYSDRNQYRIPDYFRTDLSLNLEGNHKLKKLAHSSWTLGVYNLTGRRNAYSVYFNSANGGVRGYQLSIFGQPIPTLTYNFKI